jgi:hypothetical protein
MSCFFSKTSYERCGFSMGCGAAIASEHYWKRNKKVAIKHGFEGVRERILPWHGL